MAQQPRSGTSQDRSTKPGPIWWLAPYGAFGAVLPSICAIASRSEAFSFAPDLNVFVGQVIYVAAAALLSAIFPYRKPATPFGAVLVGIGFPTIVGSAVGAVKHAVPNLTSRGGPSESASWIGTIVDSLSFF